jgi:hypothetical protein
LRNRRRAIFGGLSKCSGGFQMNTAGATELGYASRAIIATLLQHLVENKVLSPSDVNTILEKAIENIQSLRNASVRGAIEVVKDVGKEN